MIEIYNSNLTENFIIYISNLVENILEYLY